jgi:hypothetical protein
MNFLNNILVYKNTCFWLFIPIIIFNIIFFQKLPSFYLRKISHPIVLIETIIRIITIAFSLIMAITVDNKIGKIGLLIYIICTMIYFSSYFVAIYFSDALIGKYTIVLPRNVFPSFSKTTSAIVVIFRHFIAPKSAIHSPLVIVTILNPYFNNISIFLALIVAWLLA